ncbi:MAG: outer membrane receptor protein involved in Fe transport [Phenylobacterium sp.]|jgi:outer membrane receptor protein involved in Fe transport
MNIRPTIMIMPLYALVGTIMSTAVGAFTGVAKAEQIQFSAPLSLSNPALPNETIEVLGKKHQNASAPVGQSAFIDIADITPAVSNLSQLIANIPGADINGQGGLFQVYSLRGMSRWRVLTQVAGVPIHTERRAGTAASFISPWLMGQVEVIKGPVSTLYGSGGMAGITQISTRKFSGFHLQSGVGGISNDGEVNFYNAGWGNEQYSFGLAHRQEKNAFTPSGDELNSHFSQTSASFSGNWALNDHIDSQLLVLSSLGKDIGKANNDDFHHKKTTVYPEEKHLITQLGLLSDDNGNGNWQARLALHKQSLSTEVTRFDQRINSVNNDATDYSFSFLQRWKSDLFDGQWSVEQEYRDNVKADESVLDLKDSNHSNQPILAATVANSALFSSVNYQHQDWSFSAGGRLSYVKQSSGLDENSQEASQSDRAITAYTSLAYQLSPLWQVTSSISSGFRFPTVTERFYHGTTGRGQTIGNPNLVAETAKNLEAGLHYQSTSASFQLSVFNNQIKHYIERVNIDENTRSYKNLDQGDIKGIEFSFNQQLGNAFSYALSGHHLSGTDQSGRRLADVSPDKLQASVNYQGSAWQASLQLKHRFANRDVALGEQPLKAVDIITANLAYDVSDSLQLSFWLNNLTNKEYVLTADSKSTLSAERQLGLSLSWVMD